jgi:hypothetical protein
MTTKALAEVKKFDIQALPEVSAIAEVMQNNLEGGMALTFPELKVPAGGGLAWEIPTDGEEPLVEKELIGILLDYHPFNIYFKDAYSGEKTLPTCVSRDGKTGDGSPGGQCRTCKLGGDVPEAWGTGKDGIGKACANRMRVSILLEGDTFPHTIALPPTSIKSLKEYLNALTNRLKAYQTVVTRVKLIKAESKGGVTYSQVSFSKASDLDKAEAGQMMAYAKTLRPFIRQSKLEEEAPAVAQEQNGTFDTDGNAVEEGDW